MQMCFPLPSTGISLPTAIHGWQLQNSHSVSTSGCVCLILENISLFIHWFVQNREKIFLLWFLCTSRIYRIICEVSNALLIWRKLFSAGQCSGEDGVFVEKVESKSYSWFLALGPVKTCLLLLGYFHSPPCIVSPLNQMQLSTSLLLIHSSSSFVKACSTSASFSWCNELS